MSHHVYAAVKKCVLSLLRKVDKELVYMCIQYCKVSVIFETERSMQEVTTLTMTETISFYSSSSSLHSPDQ